MLKVKGDVLVCEGIIIVDVVKCVLYLLIVVEKIFLVIIGDCSVIGMVVCDQMVGLWQVLVVNCVVIIVSFDSYYGEVMVIGECVLVVLLDFVVFVCLVVGEVLINIVVIQIGDIKCIKFFVNWMVVVGYFGEDVGLYEVVKVVGEEFCLVLGLMILVGKDFMSMKICWQEGNEECEMMLLLLLVIFVFVCVEDVCYIIMLQFFIEDNVLLLIDLGKGNNVLGVMVLVQVYCQFGDKLVDVCDVV